MLLGYDDLRERIINRGLCTGCGTCVGVCPKGALDVGYDEAGEPSPTLTGECSPCGICSAACPGEDIPLPALEKFCFGKTRSNKATDQGLGLTTDFVGAYAADPAVHDAGASGGAATALLAYALEKGVIDCAVVAGYDPEAPYRGMPKLATTRDELLANAQSKYCVVSTNALLRKAARLGYEKIGITVLPCHAHGIRKLQQQQLDRDIAKRVELLVGLFCGRNFYFEGTKHLMMEWCGVRSLDDVKSIQYRGGEWPGDFIVELKNGERRRVERHLYLPQVLGRFHRDRCLMCVDWTCELADVSIGDYWDPRKKRGDFGRSSVLVRSEKGARLLAGAVSEGYLVTAPGQPEKLLETGGHEQKKHAAVFTLEQRQRMGWPTPNYHCRMSAAPSPTVERAHMPYK